MESTQVLEVLKTHSYPKGYAHTVYIDEDVDEPVYYRNVINTLDTAQEGDSVRMIISTGGGRLDTANMITYAMDCCKAEITAVLTSSCMSAGTIIALHAHKWEIGAGLDWMVHSGSFGVGGESHSVRKYHDHSQRIMREVLDREYSGFYSPEEIEDIANGSDSLLVAQEVGERLDTFAKYRIKKEEEYCDKQDEALWEENSRMVDETLSSLDITNEEKDIFNKVRTLLEESLEEVDETVEDKESPTESVVIEKEEVATEVPQPLGESLEEGKALLSESGEVLGVISYLIEDGMAVDIEVELFSKDLSKDLVIAVDSRFLGSDDRQNLLQVMEDITQRSFSKWSTDSLIASFIKEVNRQIKEN